MERKMVPIPSGRRDPRLVAAAKTCKMRCQKCNDTTHWTYDCKKNWSYAHRESRSSELKRKFVEGPDGKVKVVDTSKVEEKKPEDDDSSSSDSSSSSSESDTSSTSTSSSSSDDKEMKRKRKKKHSKKKSKKSKKSKK